MNTQTFETFKNAQVSVNSTCEYYWIPMAYYEDFLKFKKENGLKFRRIMYRGPRQFEVWTNRYSGKKFKHYAGSTRKKDATHFSVYRTVKWDNIKKEYAIIG